jgi:hypothetical protein
MTVCFSRSSFVTNLDSGEPITVQFTLPNAGRLVFATPEKPDAQSC